MKIRFYHLFLVILLLLNITVLGQEYLGYANSNYAGVHGIALQPASIVDSRYIVDINLVSYDVSLFNNYIALKRKYIRDARNGNIDDQADFRDTYLYENFEGLNGPKKQVYGNALVNLPSVLVSLDYKNSIAFGFRSRTKLIIEDMDAALAKQIWEELEYMPLWEMELNNQDLSIQTMSWIEYGGTYGREVFWIGNHYLKAAATVKLIQGLGSAYVYAEDLNYEFINDDTLTLTTSHIQYGHSSNFEFNTDNINYKFVGNPTIGWDFGVVYEWRRDKSEFEYDMDGETGLIRQDLNKYKLKLGFSVLDIGRVMFDKGDISGDFDADTLKWDITDVNIEDVESFNALISGMFGFNPNDEGKFKMNLPTTISFQVDYNIWKYFYINATAYMGMKFKNNESKVRNISSYSITPRFEHKWAGISLPYSFTNYGDQRIGLHLRLGPFFVGTNDFRALWIENKIYSANVYAGLKIPIPHGKPKDRDNDKVSNLKDLCPDAPGLWEYKGCPDTDGDGLTDNEDDCPLAKGPIENNGCPFEDLDGDGIVNESDDCPEVFGPVENNGCPWGDMDGDSIMDNDDACIDVPGPKENNGCPWGDRDEDGLTDDVDGCPDTAGPEENNGCPWGDADGDGVTDNEDACIDVPGPIENIGCPWGDEDGDGLKDNVDECPKTPGPIENNGCPVLEVEEEEIIQTAFDNLEFESSKAIIKWSSYKTLDGLAELMKKRDNARLRIAGHTDSSGSDELNMALSEKRAKAVKNYLMKKGLSDDRFIIEYYGETKPIASNETNEGKAKNRRVEMELVFE